MKLSNVQALESYLLQAAPDQVAALYLIVSKEEFDRDSALDVLRGQLLKQERTPGLCYKTFDGESLVIDQLLDELYTLPFFSKCKLVVVRRVDQLSKPELKRLEEAFSKLHRAVKLVLIASELTSNMTFYKKAELAGVVLDVPVKKGAMKEGELTAFVERQCQKQGKRIDRRVSQLLSKQIGDAVRLRQELEKLLCYVGERTEVTAQDVAAICSCVPSDTIWQLGEALCRLDTAAALRIGRGLLDSGYALLALLGQIRYQLQTGFQVSSLLAAGNSPQEVTKHFPYMVGSILEKQCRLARQYGVQRFKKGLIALADTDFKAKDSHADPVFLLERLFFELTLS